MEVGAWIWIRDWEQGYNKSAKQQSDTEEYGLVHVSSYHTRKNTAYYTRSEYIRTSVVTECNYVIHSDVTHNDVMISDVTLLLSAIDYARVRVWVATRDAY